MSETIMISEETTSAAISCMSFPVKKSSAKSLIGVTQGYLPYFVYNPEWNDFVPESDQINPYESFNTMLASEDALKKEWENPIEDEAWADL